MRREKLRVTLPAVIALGSNLGDREGTLRAAIAELDSLDGVTVTAVSSLYETDAVKPEGVDASAPAYLNAVALVKSALSPHALLDAVQAIEQAHHRVREVVWGDRTLDLDIITFAALEQHDETLTLPHPRAFERDFVLAPWFEVDPDAVVPGRGPVRQLLAATAQTPRLFVRWAS